MMICWCAGQHTPVHAHGEGKKSWLRVLSGQLLLSEYDEGQRAVSRCQLIAQGQSVEMSDGSVYHHLQNVNMNQRAISVHLYSPSVLECSGTCGVVCPVTYTPLAGCTSPLQMREPRQLYTSFERLARALEERMQGDGPLDIAGIQRMLEAVRLNPKEYQRYAHWSENRYTRNLIGYNPRYTLLPPRRISHSCKGLGSWSQGSATAKRCHRRK